MPTPLIPFTVCDILSLVTLYLIFMPKHTTSQSINIHCYPAIYICPNEILDKIFSTVCMDGGATGRTSTVSKAIVRVNVFNIARLSR